MFADLCNNNATLADLPGGALPQLLHFLTGFSQQFFGCKDESIPKNALKFYLYTRKNVKKPILLDTTNLDKIDPNKKVVFQIHGWLCSSRDAGMPEMKTAYLFRYDYNVIIVDWSVLTTNTYPDSVCSIPQAAQLLGHFICKMHTLRNVKIESIHVVGHSLGAHLAGVTGQVVRQVCGKTLGRITGLDPAGPYFQGNSIDKRLDESDANMVDVIHTNMGFMGYYGPCGTVDFFPNCGVFQPGCLNIPNITSLPNFLNLPLSLCKKTKAENTCFITKLFFLVACHHFRSVEYMAESIIKPLYVAQRCDFCPGVPVLGLCTPNIFPPFDTTLMGETCSNKTAGSRYYLTTNSQRPYPQGQKNN